MDMSKVAEIVMVRLMTGIPPCPNCDNTEPDLWALDVTGEVAMEQCMVCGTERTIEPDA